MTMKTKNQKILTEEDLLSMSADDYMNEAQIAFFKTKLEALLAELLANGDQTIDSLRSVDDKGDEIDRASSIMSQGLELRFRNRDAKLLVKVRHALQKIENGTYGWCEETGEPIGVMRLLARPIATLCLEAQAAREQKQRFFIDQNPY